MAEIGNLPGPKKYVGCRKNRYIPGVVITRVNCRHSFAVCDNPPSHVIGCVGRKAKLKVRRNQSRNKRNSRTRNFKTISKYHKK